MRAALHRRGTGKMYLTAGGGEGKGFEFWGGAEDGVLLGLGWAWVRAALSPVDLQ